MCAMPSSSQHGLWAGPQTASAFVGQKRLSKLEDREPDHNPEVETVFGARFDVGYTSNITLHGN